MKKKGISLIVLVITIIIIIILAGAVILNLSNNNPIENANKAKIMQDMDTFKSELVITIANKVANREIERVSDVNATGNAIYDYIPSMEGKSVNGLSYSEMLLISNGKLVKNSEATIPETIDVIITEALGGAVATPSTPSTPAVSYTVSYNANGGSGEMEDSTGTTVTAATNTFTAPTGKAFKNWNTESDGSGTSYNAGASITSNETLYAQWYKTTYAVGDPVTITVSGVTHNFWVIEASDASNPSVTLITKENINTDSTSANYLTQTGANTIAFSDTNYWWDTETGAIKSAYTDENGGLNNEPTATHESYALTAAKAYGTAVGGEGRLLTKAEADGLEASNSALLYANSGDFASANNFLNYWLGSAPFDGDYGVWFVGGEYEGVDCDVFGDDNIFGVRPVVTILKSNI